MFDKLRQLFKGKEEEKPSALVDYSAMVVDFHNHVLPGIDDGAKSMDDSILMLKNFEQLGVKKVIATPHSMADGYVNPNQKILKLRDELREAMKANDIHIQLDAAAEYYADELFMEKLANKDLLTFGKNYVLMELSYVSKPQNVGEIVYKLQVAGYDLILAHPERYPYYHEEDFSSYESLKDRKVYFQINIASLAGRYGAGAEYTAKRMIDEGMVEFVGSDLHSLNSFEVLRMCLKEKHLEKLLTSDKLLNKTLL